MSDTLQSISNLQRQLTSLRKNFSTYLRLSEDRSTNYYEMNRILGSIEKSYSEVTKQLGSIVMDNWLAQEKSELDQTKSKLIYDFGNTLSDLLKKKEAFELQGNFPVLNVKFFMLTLNLDSGRVQIWFGNKEELLVSVELSPEVVADAVISNYASLTKREFSDETFLIDLYRAYLTVTRKEEKQMGDDVGIVDVHRELVFQRQSPEFLSDPRKSTFREYPRPYFAYDLFRLGQKKTEEGYDLSLRIATREQNKSRDQYLWIPSDESLQGNVYSMLSFRRVE